MENDHEHDGGRTCEFCDVSVEEYGDFVEWFDGTIVCEDCQREVEQEQWDAHQRGE